jgi:ribonuclease BN (tRNA processing enzyme)
VKIKLLPSTFDADGRATQEQRLTCLLVDDCVAIDAGSIALGISEAQRSAIRDIIITHSHIDHTATLPIFVDDLFALLDDPICVHTTEEIKHRLESDVFNWQSYPRFSELSNGRTHVMQYRTFRLGEEFQVRHLRATAIPVNHTVPTIGLIITDGKSTIAVTSDTTTTEEFWRAANKHARIDALIIECSFPNEMEDLALKSGHLTPSMVKRELEKLKHKEAEMLVVHLKASYRSQLLEELAALQLPRLSAMEAGREYDIKKINFQDKKSED